MDKTLISALFFLLTVFSGAANALGDATLKILGNDNSIRNVHVGDINLRRTENVFNIIMGNGNETVNKLNSMISEGWFSSSKIPNNALISYNKSKNKMYFIDEVTGLIKEVDCYTGAERSLGSLVSMSSNNDKNKAPQNTQQHTHSAIENCVDAKTHQHPNGNNDHTHSYNCSTQTPPSQPYRQPQPTYNYSGGTSSY